MEEIKYKLSLKLSASEKMTDVYRVEPCVSITIIVLNKVGVEYYSSGEYFGGCLEKNKIDYLTRNNCFHIEFSNYVCNKYINIKEVEKLVNEYNLKWDKY